MVNSIGFTLGKTYYCGYWRENHKIIEIKDNGDVVSQWEKGNLTLHHTPFDKNRDKEL